MSRLGLARPPNIVASLFAIVAFLGAARPAAAEDVQAQADAALSGRISCAELANTDFTRLADAPTAINSAHIVPAAGGAPEYCDVKGYVAPQVQFEIRLPTAGWNGRYLQAGCGGFCGVIGIDAANDVLAHSFAVAADNMGHVGDPLNSPLWATSQDLRRDYGRRSTHVTAVAAKAILQRFYGLAPAWSYFRGCSTGGREGLQEASFFPDDFDGIIAGDPAFPGRLGAILNTWDAQHLLKSDGSPVFSEATLMVLHKAILAACDGLDGVKDGIISDPRACHFKVASIECAGGGEGEGCLSAVQVAAAEAIYDGPRNSKGERLVPGWEVFGSEAAWNDKTRESLSDGAERFLEFWPNPPAAFTYRDFNFDTDPPKIKDALVRYDPVAPGEPPHLEGFEAHRGKLIMYHGWADGGVSPIFSLDYLAQVAAHQGGLDKTRGWFRLFMVPGMFHCRGGDAPNTFDFMPSIMAWVEKGVAPDGVTAAETSEKGAIVRQRPLYAWPEYAAYKGKGDVNAADSWKPASPKTLPDDRIDWIWAPPRDGAQ